MNQKTPEFRVARKRSPRSIGRTLCFRQGEPKALPEPHGGIAYRFKDYRLLWSVVCFSCCCHWRHAGCPDDASYKANQSEELTCWLEENQLYIEDVKIDYERNILYLKLIGPKPPLNVEKYSIRKTGKNL